MDQRSRVIIPNRSARAHQGVEAEPIRAAVRYYFLSAFVSIAVFFVVWGVLHDGYDETPFLIAIISSCLCGCTFVFVREVMIRGTRKRTQAARRLSQQLRLVGNNHRRVGQDGKLTLKRNELLLAEIRAKSDAAKVLDKFADAHKEVFDLCEDYLRMVATELAAAHPSSPRVPALRRGSVSAGKRHRFHMLKWAEIKARSFTTEVGAAESLEAKIQAGEDALFAVDRAFKIYPEEITLVDSQEVLQVFLTSAKVKRSVREAEISAEKLDDEQAVRHYRDALISLERYNVEFDERSLIYEKIRSEISRIQQVR